MLIKWFSKKSDHRVKIWFYAYFVRQRLKDGIKKCVKIGSGHGHYQNGELNIYTSCLV